MAQKKGIAYRPNAVKQSFQGSGLDKMLDNITPINFNEAYYAEQPEVLEKIKSLEHYLTVGELQSKHRGIKQELSSLSPDMAATIVIIILNFLEVTEGLNDRIAVFEDGRYRIYTEESHCWKIIDEKLFLLFLAELAEKSGLPRAKSLMKKNIEELKYQFDLSAQVKISEETSDVAKINLHNGTFIVSKDFVGLREHRSDDYFFYTLPFNYDPSATCPLFMEYLDRAIPEKECQMMLAEFAGYPLARNLKMEMAAVLYGPGRTGKSTFSTVLSKMYGEENIAPYSLSSLCGTKESCSYNRADLGNYILNYSTEMGGKDCDHNLVKKVISREPVEARKPYGDPFILRNYCPVMFNVNEMPPMENTSALRRRIRFAPFLRPVSLDIMDVGYADRIVEKELSGVFNWALEGLRRLMTNKRFTVSPLGEATAKELWIENDNVLAFLEITTYVPSHSDKEYKKTVVFYAEYSEFCKENGYRKLSCVKFLKRLEGLRFVVDREATDHYARVYCKKQCDEDRIREKELDRVIN